MLDNKLLDEIGGKIRAVLAESPAADIEKNLKALLQSTFAKLDLVTREEFDVQAAILQRTCAQLEALEQRLAALENDPPG